MLTIDEALYVSVGSGNGADFRRGGALADRFRRDLGMEPREMVDRMPSDACFLHALVLNDLMRVRESVPDRLRDVEVDRAQYYLGCLNDYTKATRNGADREADRAILLQALEREPAHVRDSVSATRLYAVAAAQGGEGEGQGEDRGDHRRCDEPAAVLRHGLRRAGLGRGASARAVRDQLRRPDADRR